MKLPAGETVENEGAIGSEPFRNEVVEPFIGTLATETWKND